MVTLLERKEATEVAALLSEMNLARGELEAFIAGATPDRLIGPRKDGWSIKDHLYHLATWDSYLMALLEPQPRPPVGFEANLRTACDRTNAIVFERGKDLPLNHVLGLFRGNRGRIIDALRKRTDADLDRPVANAQPAGLAPIEGCLRDWILPLTADHDRIHHRWMRELLASA